MYTIVFYDKRCLITNAHFTKLRIEGTFQSVAYRAMSVYETFATCGQIWCVALIVINREASNEVLSHSPVAG